jgi:hypothetical protein
LTKRTQRWSGRHDRRAQDDLVLDWEPSATPVTGNGSSNKLTVRILVASAALAVCLAGGITTASEAHGTAAHNENYFINYQKMSGFQWNGYHPSYPRMTMYDDSK